MPRVLKPGRGVGLEELAQPLPSGGSASQASLLKGGAALC